MKNYRFMEHTYEEIRTKIRSLIENLEMQKYSQAEIAKEISQITDVNFYAKDINLLKNLSNNRWERTSKIEKLKTCYIGLRKLYKNIPSSNNYAQATPKEIKSLTNFLQKAQEAEFAVYKSIPNHSEALKTLEKYFHTDGSAYKNLVKVVNRVIARNWSLNDYENPSYFEIIDVRITRKKDKLYFLESEEFWFLKWYLEAEGIYARTYETYNKQLYVLEERDGIIKILKNIYSSPKNNDIFPISPK